MQRIGSRAQVMHGNAKMTGGGLMKKDLTYNKNGKIVSKKMSKMAKKEMRLQKAGYITTKGIFGVKKMSGGAKVDELDKKKTYILTKNGEKSLMIYIDDKSLNHIIFTINYINDKEELGTWRFDQKYIEWTATEMDSLSVAKGKLENLLNFLNEKLEEYKSIHNIHNINSYITRLEDNRKILEDYKKRFDKLNKENNIIDKFIDGFKESINKTVKQIELQKQLNNMKHKRKELSNKRNKVVSTMTNLQETAKFYKNADNARRKEEARLAVEEARREEEERLAVEEARREEEERLAVEEAQKTCCTITGGKRRNNTQKLRSKK